MIVCSLVLTVLLLGNIGCSEHSEKAVERKFADNTKVKNQTKCFIKDELSAVVSLIRLTTKNELVPYCGGSIIHRKIVLTAANCVVDKKGNLNISGVFIKSGSNDLTYGQVNRAAKAVMHPDFIWRKNKHNLALILVDGEFPEFIVPMKLLNENETREALLHQNRIVGWLHEFPPIATYSLKYNITPEEQTRLVKEIPFINRFSFRCKDYCQIRTYSGRAMDFEACIKFLDGVENYKVGIVEDRFCLYGANPTECHAFMGNPIMSQNSRSQHGILMNYRCQDNKDQTGGGMKVSNYTTWIEETMSKLLNESKISTEIMPPIGCSEKNEHSPIVSIRKLTKNGQLVPICGGTIIHEKVVLTAANCVTDDEGISDISELYLITSSKYIYNKRVFRFSEAIIHPEYNRKSNTNNIALIIINGRFSIDVIPFILSRIHSNLEYRNCSIYKTEYVDSGKALNESLYNSMAFQNSDFLTMNHFNCENRCLKEKFSINKIYAKDCIKLGMGKNYFNQTIGTQICVTSEPDIPGVSGDPIICSGVQFGIVSSRINTTNATVLVATSIGHYYKWIKESINKLKKSEEKVTDEKDIGRCLMENKISAVVALIRLTDDHELVPYCGGSIIHRKIVLTTASCIVDDRGNLDLTGVFVKSGSYNLRYGQFNKAVGGVTHPDYNWKNKTNAIALIIIDDDFPEYIVPMKLLKTNNTEGDLPRITGWAYEYLQSAPYLFKYNITSEEQTRVFKAMPYIEEFKIRCGKYCKVQKNEIRIIRYINCVQMLNDRVNYNFTDDGNKFCTVKVAPENIRDCREYSGNPIMLQSRRIQYGIVLGGIHCHSKKFGDLAEASTINNFVPWIEETKKKLLNENKTFTAVTMPMKCSIINDHSSVVSIYRNTEEIKSSPACGGSVIHKRIVLTTAYCLTDGKGIVEIDTLYVVASSGYYNYKKVFRASEAIVHPDYERNTTKNDIALLIINGHISEKITPMKLALNDKESMKRCSMVSIEISDHKKDAKQNNTTFLFLTKSMFFCKNRCSRKMLPVSTIHTKDCIDMVANITHFPIQTDGSEFCTNTSKYYDECQEKNGFPIVCSEVQYGIVKSMGTCKEVHRPIVASDVAYHLYWIRKTMSSLIENKKV